MQISQKALTYLSLSLVFLLFFLPLIDTDLGWHLRYGEHFLTTGNFLKTNELTYFLKSYTWPNSYTLYQILVTLVYKFSGLFGLSILYSIWAISTFIVFRKITPHVPRLSLIAFTIPVVLGSFVFSLGFRSQVFTFTGIVIAIYIIKRAHENKKLLLLLPPIFALWANLHGGFVLGLAILAFGALEYLKQKRFNAFALLSISGFFSALATLINPYGVEIYTESLKHVSYPLWGLIAEWVPPLVEYKALIVVSTIPILFFAIKQRKFNVMWLLSISLFFILAFQARRNVPLFFLVLSIATLDLFSKSLKRVEDNKIFQKLSNLTLICGILWFLLMQIPKTVEFDTNWQSFCTKGMQRYPCRAIEYIRANPIDGKNAYAPYEWGGFLEWQLPQYKFFVDGRMPAWPTPDNKSPYTTYLEIVQAQSDYQEKLLSFDTDWLILGPGTFLDIELQEKKGEYWKERYRDQYAVIYTKNGK